MPNPTAITVLNSAFWNELGALFNEDEYTDLGNLIQDKGAVLAAYSSMNYGNLEFFEWLSGMPTADIAAIAYLDMGLAFYKVYKALTANYNPLENYFTDRTYSESVDGSNERSGSVESTPSGTVSNTYSGTKETENNEGTSTLEGTAYDDENFRNISKNTVDTTIYERFNQYGSTTSYNGYKVTQTYNKLTDEQEASKDGSENRSGSSGIFSKQDLTQREIDLRLKNRIFPILVRMVVDVLNAGVYAE